MSDQHDYSMYCDEICCSDFLRFQDTASHYSDLAYPIHDLFQIDMFLVQGDSRESNVRRLTENEYDRLEVALRLASRMLHDDVSLRYFATMHDGTLHTSQGGEAKTWDQIDREEAERTTAHNIIRQPPTAIDVDRAKNILDNLVAIVDPIVFTQLPGGFRAITSWMPDEIESELSQSAKDKFPRAPKPILIMIERTYALNFNFMNQYALARTLVHEVAHAIEHAASGRKEYQTFYQDSPTDEAGFELEAALFGGSYVFQNLQKLDSSGPDEYVLLRDHWLSSNTCSWYGETKIVAPIQLRKDGVNPPQLDEFFVMSRVPHGLVEDMCHDSFWDARKQGAALNLCPIVPTNVYRWVFKLVEKKVVPCKPTDDDLPDRMKREFQDIMREKRTRNDNRLRDFSKPPAYVWEVDRDQRTAREQQHIAERVRAAQQAQAAQPAGPVQNTAAFPNGNLLQGGALPDLRP